MLTPSDIAKIYQMPGPVLTVYLNTQPAEPSRHPLVPASIVWLKEELNSLEPNIAKTERNLFREQAHHAEEFFRNRQPQERSLAIFAGHKLWHCVPFQVEVNNELHWGPPAVSQLLWLVDEHRPYCVVVVDLKGARFLRYHLRELLELQEMKFVIDISEWRTKDLGHVMGQSIHKGRGLQRDFIDDRVKAQYAHLCRHVGEQAAALCRKEGLRAIFLVGEAHLAEPIESFFPEELRRRATLVKEDLGHSSLSELQNRLEPVIKEWECRHEQALVDELLSSERGTVTLVDEVLTKLQQGNVRLLVVARDTNLYSRQCVQCGWVDSATGPTCPKCGAICRHTTLCDVLPELVRKHQVDLEIVSGDAEKRLRRTGEMGGWLRKIKHAAR